MNPRRVQATEAALAARAWDLGAALVEAATEAAAAARPLVALVVMAEGCPGSLMLRAQLVGDAWDRLEQSAAVIELGVGHARARPLRTLDAGDTRVSLPGTPTMLLWARATPGVLVFHSLGLGPLAATDAHGDIKRLIEGTSRWVPEAASAQVALLRRPLLDPRETLTAAGRFHSEWRLNFP